MEYLDSQFLPEVMNTEIFRLASVLYADSNYEVNSSTIHRKIIESVFVENKNRIMSIYDLSSDIQSRYSIFLDHDEIKKVIKKSENFVLSPNKTDEINISLSAKRYGVIIDKITKNNLEYFIEEFSKINPEISSENYKDIIYQFLYEIFKTNLTSFSKLVDSSITVADIINISEIEFNPIEIEIINSFINWDNNEKNKAIFDISNIALEYCLISNKKGNSFKLENLRNKNFYLDTNILFRAIGVNGENRMNKTITFLEKFIEAKENLFITKYTEEEFRKTIKFYVNSLEKKYSPKINSRVFIQYSKSSDFINFYHKWRRNRVNDNLDLFEAYIMSQLKSLMKKFNILCDYKSIVDMDDVKIKDSILDKSSQINTYKSSEKNFSSYIEGNVFDAQNIHIIEEKRNGAYINIFDCKYFMISSDKYLQKWDYTRNKVTPIVILPSQWMSILLRYLNRTEDDFKSFVSFLNINSSEKTISNENLHLVLQGISEITQDFSIQSSIITEMINNKFQGILDKNVNDEQIVFRAKDFAKSKLEKDLESFQDQHKHLEHKFERYQLNTISAIEKLQQEKDFEKNEKALIEEDNKRITKELIDAKVRLDYLKFKGTGYICLVIGICSFVMLVLTFFYTDRDWNFMNVFKNYANSIPENSIEKEVVKYIYLLLFPVMAAMFSLSYKRLVSISTKNGMKQKLYEKYETEK